MTQISQYLTTREQIQEIRAARTIAAPRTIYGFPLDIVTWLVDNSMSHFTTAQVLAQFPGAKRSNCTAALSRLAARGLIRKLGVGKWMAL